MRKNIHLLLAALILFAACSEKVELSDTSVVLDITAISEAFKPAGGTTTRASENNYKTEFTNGDQIGITVIKDGKIVDGVNNICFTYDASTAKWTADAGSPSLYYYQDATYLAYYPYDAAMSDKISEQEIIDAFTPQTDQFNYTNYTKSDLMVTTGTADRVTKTLGFSFTHLMAMLEFQFTQNLDGTASTVLLETGSTLTATSGGVNYQFCEVSTEKCYRLLLKPSVTLDFNLNYIIGNKTYSHSETGVVMPVAGKYLRYNFLHRQSAMEVEVSMGDYIGALGDVSRVVINSTSYALQKKANNHYVVSHLTTMPVAGSLVSIYINDNQEIKEVLLLTTVNAEFNGTDNLISVKLSKNGMEGEGTQAKPYQVTTPVQLRGVQEGQSSITATGSGNYYYSQMNDIDISTYTSNWQSIKSGLLYDGQGYKIKNFNSTYGGIFSYNGGTIQNVHLESGTINSSGIIGGIVNSNHSQKLYNCSNGASVTTTSEHVGGMTGLGDWSTIEHCKNTGAISGVANVGGIAGYCYGTKIRYCYNTGAVAGTNDACGGICATLGESSALIEYCYNSGAITDTGNANKGSLVGNLGFVSGNLCQYCWGVTDANLDLFGVIQNGAISTDNNSFDSNTHQWPSYTTDVTNGWGSSHWKSYAKGEYPKLNWE